MVPGGGSRDRLSLALFNIGMFNVPMSGGRQKHLIVRKKNHEIRYTYIGTYALIRSTHAERFVQTRRDVYTNPFHASENISFLLQITRQSSDTLDLFGLMEYALNSVLK